MYLHELGDGAGSFTKDDMQAGKHQEYEQQLIAFYSKKMGLNSDKDSKVDWPVDDSSENRTSPCLPSGAAWAGKNEEDDNTTQPVIENDNNLIPQCKEDWEGSWAPPVAAPDHVPPATASKEQPTNPPQTSNTSAGWGNTENSARALDTSSLFSADQCSGLGLANLHLKVYGEDDLGFDPWNECSKGLADLLQEEEQTPKHGSTQHISTAPHMHSFPSSSPRNPDNLRNWQDGLRALLPNINISFSESLLSQQQNSWPQPSTLATEPTSSNWPFSSQPPSSLQVRPPPGFECKSPSTIDDPSILWSKTFDPGNPQINKPITRPVSNGFPGMHPITRPADLQSSASHQERA